MEIREDDVGVVHCTGEFDATAFERELDALEPSQVMAVRCIGDEWIWHVIDLSTLLGRSVSQQTHHEQVTVRVEGGYTVQNLPVTVIYVQPAPELPAEEPPVEEEPAMEEPSVAAS